MVARDRPLWPSVIAARAVYARGRWAERESLDTVCARATVCNAVAPRRWPVHRRTMTLPDLDRRARVHALLRDATDLKLRTAHMAEALRLAVQARALAVQAPRLHDPWPQITA